MPILKSKRTIIILLVAAAALLWAIRLYENDAEVSLQEEIESRGSRILGTRVDVGDITVNWNAGRLSLADLSVASPGGFSGQDMISVDSVEADLDFETRVIDRITLRGVEAVIEFRGARSNFQTMGDRVARRSAGDDVAGGSADGGDAGEGDSRPEADAAGGVAPDDWRVESIEFDGVRVRVQADWTSKAVEFDAGGFSIDALDAGTEDLARAVTVRFLDRVLVSAADRVDNDRLRNALLEKAEALRTRLRPPQSPQSE